ncbi:MULTISPECIES: C40 family peptidase [Streptomyces]|uniref:C40 family peptidase n=1 Tax=Streptomyces TaxID=1883 RepID=UPI002271EFB1|nr:MULTISPECIES: C40 family peptidase [unclassified Streptomyces]MCY0943941.1 NlpC/P60 family protein [Streptomyces sp. H34-AA3]MCY0950983.1 NlpC/P60 family protein [Streptomyces sp. H27-S2]MCZ4082598.1 NlpC/P60 family protein [Streptomyces sp. H34-S5]
MASHRRPKQPTRARVTVLTATAAAAVALSAQGASAAPAKPGKEEVKSQVDALYEEAEQATEKFNGARERQEKLEKEIGQLQDQVARGQGDLNELRSTLGSMASAQYRGGGIDPSLALFLSADPDSYLDKAASLDHLSGKQVEAVQKIQAKQRSLAQQRQEASGKLADLDATRKELGEKKKVSTDKLAEAQALLNTLTAQERTQLKEEETKASRSAGERVELGDVKPSGRAGAALAAAKTKLGTAYVMGATGPSAYDCSGLTQWAYKQAGVSITRTTYTQANDGKRVSRSELQPGDLVFFYGDLHHVGLYAGNNMTLHASNPRGGIKYESMDNMPFQFGVRI